MAPRNRDKPGQVMLVGICFRILILVQLVVLGVILVRLFPPRESPVLPDPGTAAAAAAATLSPGEHAQLLALAADGLTKARAPPLAGTSSGRAPASPLPLVVLTTPAEATDPAMQQTPKQALRQAPWERDEERGAQTEAGRRAQICRDYPEACSCNPIDPLLLIYNRIPKAGRSVRQFSFGLLLLPDQLCPMRIPYPRERPHSADTRVHTRPRECTCIYAFGGLAVLFVVN